MVRGSVVNIDLRARHAKPGYIGGAHYRRCGRRNEQGVAHSIASLSPGNRPPTDHHVRRRRLEGRSQTRLRRVHRASTNGAHLCRHLRTCRRDKTGCLFIQTAAMQSFETLEFMRSNTTVS